MARIGIFAIDPGTTTGVARGIFPVKRSVWEGLAAGAWESWEVGSSPAEQAWEIMGEYRDWINGTYTPPNPILVAEGFGVRLGMGSSSSDRLLDPIRVTAGCEALSWGREGLRWAHMAYQPPSDKSFATNARLRDHGLWVVGSEHRRDAVRHMVKCYSGYIKKTPQSVD